jgi:hypothetical protein
MVTKRERWPTPNIERLILDLQSPDDEVRGEAVRSLCPCHAGWEMFEQKVDVVLRLLRDRSQVVRAHALHVIEDAARMQVAEDLGYHREAGEETIGEKRASRFRSTAERFEARRNKRIRNSRRRHG